MVPEVRIRPDAYVFLSGYLLLMPLHWVFGWLLAAFVHELGHCCALWLFDIPIYRITLGGMGARIDAAPMQALQHVICSLAGPAAGLLLLLFAKVFPVAAFCALLQSGFNLLPVYPLDGGRALQAMRR